MKGIVPGAVDGGGGYWNPHPGDNPQAMLTGELIPMCQRKALGVGQRGASNGSEKWASPWAATEPSCSPRSTRA